MAVDNHPAPKGLRLHTEVFDTVVAVNIESERRLETLIATLDDLLRSIQVAEAALATVKTAG